MYIKNLAAYFCTFIFLCTSIKSEETTQNHTITVFVHGTYAFRKFVQYTPFRPIIYCQPGLSLAKSLPKKYHFHNIAHHCAQQNPKLYNLDQFYVFGWKSEYIYDATRQQAAKQLVQELQMLVNSYYNKHTIIPKIQLIGFSHGGNVILHTANYLPVNINGHTIEVEIWLFGTPVQTANQELINSQHFTKTYAIYSKKDWMQRMDPQGLRNKQIDLKNLWSKRTFESTDRCIQVEFTVNNKPIAHSYYRYIFHHLANIQNLIKEESEHINSGLIHINFNT